MTIVPAIGILIIGIVGISIGFVMETIIRR